MKFHAHVYFKSSEKDSAVTLRQAILDHLTGKITFVSELLHEPRGPHPLPSFEVHYLVEFENPVLQVLTQFQGNLSILIHPDTGDDHRDHSENVRWLGQPLKLDFSFFDKIKLDPSLRINQ